MLIMAKKPREPVIPTPEAIRALRLRLGLSLEECAARVGVSPLTWYGWELPSQKRRPSRSHAILLALLAAGKI